jgi:hypothetical protein
MIILLLCYLVFNVYLKILQLNQLIRPEQSVGLVIAFVEFAFGEFRKVETERAHLHLKFEFKQNGRQGN